MCALPASPGVYTQIIDQSEYVQQTGGTTGFSLILSEGGEDNTLVFVSSQSALINKFGSPNMKLYGQSLYNAMNFLGVSGSFYILRPLPTVEDTGDLLLSLPSPTVTTPWVNKPATFAGKVIGYVISQDTRSENISYFDSVIENLQIYTVGSNPSLPLDITINQFLFESTDTLYVYLNTSSLIEGVDFIKNATTKKVRILSTSMTSNIKQGDVIRIFKRSVGYFDFTQFDVAGPIERYTTIEMDASFYSDPEESTTLVDNKVSNFILLQPWSSKTTYANNAFVNKDGYKFISLVNNNKGNDPSVTYTESTYSTWSSSATYNTDDIVYVNGEGLYKSLINGNTNNNPVNDDGSKWERLPIFWKREEVMLPIVDLTNFPVTVYLPFMFIPGQKQLTVKINGENFTNYDELSTGTAINLKNDSDVVNGATITVQKKGVIPLVRFTNKFIDPQTDESINTNFRSLVTDMYGINNKPLSNSWLLNNWTYGYNSLSSSTTLNMFKPLIVFSSRGRGKYGNKLTVRIAPTFSIDGHYIVSVNLYNPLVNTEATVEQFTVSFVPGTSLTPGESSFIEDVINTYSEYIYVYTDQDELIRLSKMIDPVETYYLKGTSASFVDPSTSTPVSILDRLLSVYYTADPDSKQVISTVPIYFTGGHEGCLLGVDGQSINSTVFLRCFSYAAKGIYDSKILNTDSVFIDVIFDANFPTEIKAELLDLCKRRGDCYLEADLTKAVSVRQALDNRLSKDTFNSYLVSYTTPFAKITSTVEGKEIVVSPTYFLSSLIPSSDSVSEVWFAAAGPNRGVINTPIKKLLFTLDSQGDYDLLYLNQINPIVYKAGRYMLFSQLTSQRKASALQDKNIVRLILYLNRVLKRAAFEYLGEPNDRLTWSAVQNNLNQILADVARRRGLYSYKVVVGASEYEIKQKMFHVNITIQPTRITEKILLNFIVR